MEGLLDPAHTVLVTQECQVGVIGKGAPIKDLVAAAQVAIPNMALLAEAARETGVPVVHCTFVRRADGRGSGDNAPLLRVMPKLGVRLEPGSREAQVIPELAVAPSDLVLERRHGVGPMGGTDLDAVCRNLGARTIVGIGVSVNVGITSLVMDAVNLGYEVVVPRDAVAGAPTSYADAVIEGTLTLLATIVDAAEVVSVWNRSGRTGRR